MSIGNLAEQIGIAASRVYKLLPLTYLAPGILIRIHTGDLPPSLPLDDLLTAAERLDWPAQRAYLSLPAAKRSGGSTHAISPLHKSAKENPASVAGISTQTGSL